MREHPVRLLLLVVAAVVAAVVVRNATADQGGVYDPAEETP